MCGLAVMYYVAGWRFPEDRQISSISMENIKIHNFEENLIFKLKASPYYENSLMFILILITNFLKHYLIFIIENF